MEQSQQLCSQRGLCRLGGRGLLRPEMGDGGPDRNGQGVQLFTLVEEDQHPIGAALLVENASNHIIKRNRSTGKTSGELAGFLKEKWNVFLPETLFAFPGRLSDTARRLRGLGRTRSRR